MRTTNMQGPRSRGGWAVAVLAVLVLMVLPVPSAMADETPPVGEAAGSGSLAGAERVEDWDWTTGTLCIKMTRSIFALRGVGTYHGRTTDGQQDVVYRAEVGPGQPLHANGPLQVEVKAENYYHGPYGTHGPHDGPEGTDGDETCSPATANRPVPAEFRIYAAEQAQDLDQDGEVDVLSGQAWVYRLDENQQKVPCVGRGSFARGGMDSDQNWRARWSLDADCTVVSNEAGAPGAGVAAAGTLQTHSGVHEACFSGYCVDNFRVDYNQFIPFPGFHVAMGGPASAPVGTSVAVVAAVTNDGVAVPGAAVAFSVTGPAPAQPPAGAAATGADGRATFTFTAAVAGDYVVSASATSGASTASGTHAVRFTVPPPTLVLDGPARWQTEENLTVTGTFTSGGKPVPAAQVSFSVAGPGQATPPSASGLTDASGKAAFTFAADRTGDYTVSATGSLPSGGGASATHGVHLDINTFSLAGMLPTSDQGNQGMRAAVVDPAGDYAYFTGGGTLSKVNLDTFKEEASISISDGVGITSAVIDPAGHFAYFGSSEYPARVFKVDLRSFQQVDSITLPPGEGQLASAVIDPAGTFAYFGGYLRVVKISLTPTFKRVEAITTEGQLTSAVMDPAGRYAYFGAKGTETGRVVKIGLDPFERVGAAVLSGAYEAELSSAVIDPAGRYGYFGTRTAPGRVVKVDLTTLQRAGAITLNSREANLSSAVIDPAGRYAYFGLVSDGAVSNPNQWMILKVDLATFERVHVLRLPAGELGVLRSAVMDPAGGFAYFGKALYRDNLTQSATPAKVVRVAVSRPPKAALAAADDTYPPIAYATPLSVSAPGVLANDRDREDNDPLTAHDPSDPAGGSVSLNPDGSFTYTPDAGFFGVDTFTYTASDGMDYSAPATVTVTVSPPPEGVASVKGSAYGFSSSVSLFGGPAQPRGPAPTVTLSPDGSNSPQTATAPTGEAIYGPAQIFTSGQLDVSTRGSTGPGGSVATSTNVANVNRGGNEKFTAANVASTCTASQTGVTASTTITNGVLEVSEGDPNVYGDETVVTIPVDPAPNTTYEGQLEGVGDHFKYVFNEQILNPDGSITVYAAHQYLLGPTAIGDLFIGKSECGVTTTGTPPPPPVTKAVADFDGNGTTDRSVFRNGAWYAEGQPPAYLGLAADTAVPGDYDGNGTTERAVYRNGAWFTEGQPTVYLGLAEDVPVPADYDGDGTTDRAVYRPSAGAWFIEDQAPIYHGTAGDIPVPGDYDGTGTTEVAVFRPESGGWYIVGQEPVFLGLGGDIPVPGDYDGNGTTDRSVYRAGAWYVDGQDPAHLGLAGDIPVPGRYDTRATTDRAVWRPTSGAWHLDGQPPVHLGAEGDVPLPLPAAIHRAFF